MRARAAAVLALALASCVGTGPTVTSTLSVWTEPDRAVVRLGERELVAYVHDPTYAIPHLFPLTSPSGKDLVEQHPEPYPHHRALWVVDRVQLEGGPDVDFYHHWKNHLDPERPELGHRHRIRHDALELADVSNGVGRLGATLTWVSDTVGEDGSEDLAAGSPVLDQAFVVRVLDLGEGEALLDLAWTLSAAHGPVTFRSDWVHYAWPYLRMDPAFAGEAGGTILSDSGATGQADTNEDYHRWIDYSNTVDGVREGVAVFVLPTEDGQLPKWLTREYGTFGPRRVDDFSGTGFVLPAGASLTGRAGIYVHGDADADELEARYDEYLDWIEGDRR